MADALPPAAHLAASFCSSQVKRSPACDACRAHPRRARPRAPLHCRDRRRHRSSLCGSANTLTSPVAMTLGESGAGSNESDQFTRRVTPEPRRFDETAARWWRQGLLTLTCDPQDEVPGGTRRSPGDEPGDPADLLAAGLSIAPPRASGGRRRCCRRRARSHPADRGGDPAALRGRLELPHGLLPYREAGREGALVSLARHDAAAVAGELVGQIMRVADAEDLRAGPVPDASRRKSRGRISEIFC
jgi:hypothetical protein